MDMKKLFPEDKGTKKGVREFLDKRGFYIVLLLCIAVVAATAVFVTNRKPDSKQPDYEARSLIPEEDGNLVVSEPDQLNAQQPEDTQASAAAGQKSEIDKPASIVGTDGNNAVQSKEDATKITASKEPVKPVNSTASKASSSKSTAPVKQQSFEMPVNGDISLEYALDKLVYSKTLEEWRAHAGVDIASDRGTPVRAVADGVVSEVRNDSYYGIAVVIDHGNGLKSLYRNLASDETVTVNQKVKQGEAIGSIGNSAMDESSEQPHLHFEVLKKDVSMDPLAYLPKSPANVD